MNPDEIREALRYFYGTENYYIYRNPFGRETTMRYTDGVQKMAELCKAYWLIDAVISHQHGRIADERFQIWVLKRHQYKSGSRKGCGYWELEATDGNDNPIARQKIEFSDFPLDEIKLYFSRGVLMLPSEY